MALVSKLTVEKVLDSYSKDKMSIATLCSHSSLQIFYSAKKYGFKTIGIVTKNRLKTMEAFPESRPDEFIVVDSFADFPSEQLIEKNALVIPHGSLVEYAGESILDMKVPIFGNRRSLLWERNRVKMLEWLSASGIKTPKTYASKKDIDRLSLVKLPGAKGGAGYTLVSSPEEFDMKVPGYQKDLVIQEFLVGVRLYPHFFFSPLSNDGYRTKNGSIEMLGVDRRIETTADEIYRSMSVGLKSDPSFVVIANEPIVVRESLLPKMFEYAEGVIDKSYDLFGGLIGPFCIELLCTGDLELHAFEVSARIVAGTSIFINSSPYSIFTHGKPLSMSDRIMEEIRLGVAQDRLKEVFY